MAIGASFLEYQMLAVGSNISTMDKYNVESTTDLDYIISFLSMDCKKIVFTTYQSSDILICACQSLNFVFDFAVIDEAHNTVTRGKYSSICFNDDIQISRRLFMTATPVVLEENHEISMGNVSLYGEDIFTLTTSDAISRGILTDYKIIVIGVKNIDFILDSVLNSKDETYQTLLYFLELSKKNYHFNKTISFHNSIDNATQFSSLLNSVNTWDKIFTINSLQTIEEREWNIDQFKKNDNSIITNSRILLEGFDLKPVDSILFADIKKSHTSINQAIGRSLRKSPGKELSFVLLPLFLTEEGEILNKKQYEYFIDAISNLYTTDKRIIDKTQPFRPHLSNVIEFFGFNGIDSYLQDQIKTNISLKVINRVNSVLKLSSYNEFKNEMNNVYIPLGIDQGIKYINWARGTDFNDIPFPDNFFSSPIDAYKRLGFEASWSDIFTTTSKISFEDFKKVMNLTYKPLGISNGLLYNDWAVGKIFKDVPFPSNFYSSASSAYQRQGIAFNWYDVFGNKNINDKIDYHSFCKKMTELYAPLGIDSSKKYIQWASGKKFEDIPFPDNFCVAPQPYYSKRKILFSWDAVFGRVDFVSYEDFVTILNSTYVPLGIDNSKKYYEWARGYKFTNIPFPKNFSLSPPNEYNNMLSSFSWAVVFGSSLIDKISYEEFVVEMRSLYVPKGIDTYQKFLKWGSGKEFQDIPFPTYFFKQPIKSYGYQNINFSWNDVLAKNEERVQDHTLSSSSEIKNFYLNL